MSRALIIKIVASLVLVGGAVTLLAMSGSESSALYKHVDEVVSKPDQYEGKLLKVHGHIVPGTIQKPIVDQQVHYSFDLEWNGSVISISQIGGEFPDTAKDGTEVVATGKLVGPAQFKSTELSAKCASKYKQGEGGRM